MTKKASAMAGKSKAKTQARRQALVVAGMHRSGTSAMARLLSLAGATLPERVMDPGPDNPMGYWEPWEMVALDDAILQSVDSRWDNVFALGDDARAWAVRDQFLGQAKAFLDLNFGDRDLLVMKDPRASILTRFWRQALDEIAVDPVYVIMVRHPFEVAESLKARSGASREASLMLWTSYMLAVERDTRDTPRIFVSYSDLLSDWRGVLARVEAAMGRPLPERTSQTDAEIDQFLSRSHRHHEADAQALAQPDVWPGAGKTYGWMQAAARGEPGSDNDLQAVAAELAALEHAVGPALVDLRRQLAQIPLAQAEAAQAREAEAFGQYRLAEAREQIETLTAHVNRLHAQADAATQMATYQTLRADGEEAKGEILHRRLSLLEHEVVDLRAALDASQGHVRSLQAEIGMMLASTSWRLTRPLRALMLRLRR